MNPTQARWARAVEMRDVQNMSFEAIGKTMGIAENSARRYVSLGRRPDGYEHERKRQRVSRGQISMAEWRAKQIARGGWTKDKVATLKKLWPTHTGGQIARKIGKTRNAVMGKVQRLGLKPKKERKA